MRTRIRSPRRVAVLATVAALGAGLLAGCADDGDSSGPSGGTDAGGKTKITVGVFGAFGLKEAGLYDEYMKLHKNIVIEQTSIERSENYRPQLLTHLASGSGLADIQAIEVNYVAEITETQGDKLVDLGKAEGVKKDNFLPWKWAQGTTKAGKTVGLGTDVGPTGICYRKDYFEQAGLPTDREAVGKLWAGDWQKYLEVGKQFKSKNVKGATFVDAASGVMNAMLGSSAERFYDKDGKLVYKTNPAVRDAWDTAAAFSEAGLTSKVQQFTPPWDQAFANGRFATVTCPPWMLGYIQDKAGDAGKDKWDVAPAPKPGNWGGSFLSVPEAGKNKEEATKLAVWLTAPEQQAKLFEKRGSFPSAQAVYSLPQVSGAKHPYFANAPIGQIFTDAAKGVPVQPVGPGDLVISQNISDVGMLQVDQKGVSSEDGWKAATKAIDNALDK
ncbi:ABC transporter substrate-binding protein [Streptomyces sp. NRRL F-5135]|uniref:ABC transporter substrate-binding protein n=1 Tax=Streptomyces sp. NRRL F-5135 TaxID=1463858 RepID=UPI0004C8EEA9|nr:extracellular solute-binding protein [Streptomyces sp. NRRL F-5135]